MDVSETTVQSWMERLRKLYKGYDLKDICTMDGSASSFKALKTKGVAKKAKQTRSRKWSEVSNFSNPKFYMQVEIMEDIFSKLNQRMIRPGEKCRIIHV